MAVQAAHPNWQRAIVVLAGSVVGALTIGAMYWAQAVFIPVALAIFLTFMLNPVVLWLQKRGLARVFSVLAVVAAAGLLVVGMIWLLTWQIAGLAGELPKHTENIKAKIRSVRSLVSTSSEIDKFKQEITRELTPEVKKDGKTETPEAPRAPVEVQSAVPSWMSGIPGIAGTVLEGLAQFALAFILVVFMLLNREDLRDRIIRLAGKNQVTMTTKALDEAGTRISKFLLMQAIVNGTFGIAISIGLLALRVDYAILWGFVGAVLRYVPYIGPWVAAVLPIGVSVMMAEHWGTVVGVVGLFLVVELISNNVMEPKLYGQSMGVSEVALLVAAAFWAFLWGPIGLVLSAPLTVCMVVLGRYVPQLQFIDILMSDQPALDADVRFYQRALARDPDEASGLVLDRVKLDHGEQVFDELLIPAMSYAKRDRERDYISEDDETFLLQVVDDVLTDLSTQTMVVASTTNPDGSARCDPSQQAGIERAKFLACAARDRSDHMALGMLRQLLPTDRWDMEIMPLESLSSELIERAEETKPSLICIASLPPGGLSHTRYLCKRLKARHPDVKIIVGRWGTSDNAEHNRDLLKEAGADWVSMSLIETREQLCGWRPVIAAQTASEEKTAASMPKLSAT
ncbi:MAG: AI-2E family transporter [Gemmataceae bacterium]|nr:AI-2E family transporter [Gemmataceae bacterium]